MAITPQTNLKLLKSTLSLDNMNQIKFASATSQYNYFNSLTKLESSNFTYQRKDNVIRYPAHIDTLMEYDYCMYQNSNYTNKWFYAYIVRMEYVNDNMTNIYIKTDPYQTWQFDLTFKQSFVEREHVNDDTAGLHTVPENLETGEFVVDNIFDLNWYDDFSGADQFLVCVAVSDLPTDDSGTHFEPQRNSLLNYAKTVNDIYSGLLYCIFPTPIYASIFISRFDSDAKAQAINNVFLVPRKFVLDSLGNNKQGVTTVNLYNTGQSQAEFVFFVIQNTTGVEELQTYSYLPPTSLHGYTPRNKKLLTGAYHYMLVSNNAGQEATFNYEDFIDNSPSFKIIGTLSSGCDIKLMPNDYKFVTPNNPLYVYSITGAKLPICSWINDPYTNWLTQNSVNTGIGIAGSVIAAGVGVATGNPIAVTSGLLGVAQSLGSVYEHSLVPKQAEGNINTGNLAFSLNKCNFIMYDMSIKPEYSAIIDKFFDLYGYKVNIVKVPNITGRRNWNYVKTIDCNIEGYIPQEDLAEIKGMFNNGVTIWHNPSTFLDYSQNNDII